MALAPDCLARVAPAIARGMGLRWTPGNGGGEPGSLAYYGGRRWHEFRESAQDSLEPFVFAQTGEGGG